VPLAVSVDAQPNSQVKVVNANVRKGNLEDAIRLDRLRDLQLEQALLFDDSLPGALQAQK